jgi:hypothetical protein
LSLAGLSAVSTGCSLLLDFDGELSASAIRPEARDPASPDRGESANGAPRLPPNTPVLIEPLYDAGSANTSPALSADQLEMYFCSTRVTGEFNIWLTRRDSVTGPWGAPQQVQELSSSRNEYDPALSADGLTITFAREVADGDLDLMLATRTSRTAPWSPPVPIVELNTTAIDVAPAIRGDDLELFFSTDTAPSPEEALDLDLRRAVRTASTSAWRPLGPLDSPDELNTTALEQPCGLGRGGLVMLVCSNRDGTQGKKDIWLTSRATLDASFEPPVLLPFINSTDEEDTAWTSDDLSYIVFGSGRTGELQLYEFYWRPGAASL